MQPKQIFSEESPKESFEFQPKQTFDEAQFTVEPEIENVEAELIIEESLKPPRFWLRLFMFGFVLFLVAAVAQSVQYVIDSWLQNRWIELLFAVALLGVSSAGVGVLIREWRTLIWLRKHQQQQLESQQLLQNPDASGEKVQQFCQNILQKLPHQAWLNQAQTQWQQELDEGHNAKEVLYLFNENILSPLDEQVKKLISVSAVQNAVIVAASPLAIVDMLFVVWRNFRLINQITQAYGMQLGYFSRLKLFRQVLINMVFAGATEVVTDLGADIFSKNLTAMLSMRVGQGLGVGLLTTRLGLKTMEFCRPIAFEAEQRPKLSLMRQQLLSAFKTQFTTILKQKEPQAHS